MPLGLFKGVRTYTLEANPDGIHFHMREEYTGPLLGMIWKSIPDLGPSFHQFANGLKARAESSSLQKRSAAGPSDPNRGGG